MSARTDGAMLSAEELELIRSTHRFTHASGHDSQWFCLVDAAMPRNVTRLLSHIDALTARLAAAEAELAVMRPVAQSASDVDWHFKRHGKGRLIDDDYTLLWRLRDCLEALRHWASNDDCDDATEKARKREGLRQLTQLSQEMGLYDAATPRPASDAGEVD